MINAFFFHDAATTEIYTLSLHDALPILLRVGAIELAHCLLHQDREPDRGDDERQQDRKSTRLNSSHPSISYAVFCLKKKNQITEDQAKDEYEKSEKSLSYQIIEGKLMTDQ